MKARLTAASFVVLAASAIFVGPARAQEQARPFNWDGVVAQGKTVEVRGVNGTIEAALSSDGRVHVSATRSARRSDPESVTIEVVEDADGVRICAVYPSRRARQASDCRGGDGPSNGDDNDVRVDFTVRVPAGVRFAGSTVNGGIEATGLRSDVEASTVNGGVRVETSGTATASTVNGDIRARVGVATPRADMDFSTVNGSIELVAPAGLNADVDASTVNGDIDSDFAVSGGGVQRGRFTPSATLNGAIGRGGEDLELSTVNGEIRLRRS